MLASQLANLRQFMPDMHAGSGRGGSAEGSGWKVGPGILRQAIVNNGDLRSIVLKSTKGGDKM